MDNLVLIRVASVLDRRLARGVFREAVEESRQRLRIVFDGPERTASVIVSLRPEQPWIGRPVGRWEAPPRHPGPFTTRLLRELRGVMIDRVEKAPADRVVTLRFADGRGLVAELATHGANLVLLDPEGRVAASARKPRSAAARLAPGTPYAPPPLPGRLLDPFGSDADEIDRFLDGVISGGEAPFEALRRHVFGVGSEGARLVLDECPGLSPGQVLAERLRGLAGGEIDPAIEAPEDPLVAAREGRLDSGQVRLLPWPPSGGAHPGMKLITGADAAATAAIYYEALERHALATRRRGALAAILEREVDRLQQAERAAAADLSRFEEPERYRRQAEALLAGLGRAERIEGNVIVPDPYDPDEKPLVIPDRPGMSLEKLAGALFARHRRAERGRERARGRLERLRARRGRLDEMGARHAEAGPEAMVALEQEMREAGIPVSLERTTRSAKAAARLMPLRLEGVRLFVSTEGHQILAGRGGKENHRLTFKLAGPEDFWFHALGCPGAHVVVRNDGRRRRPPRETLEQAAAVAAWFSEARDQAAVDVQWTRRKYVRRPRGAPPGTVVLKRFETVRVRPGLPPEA